MSSLLRESLVYALGAAAAFAVDFALLWLLVAGVGIHYLPAAALSFLAGTVVVYRVSVRHAFRYRRVADRKLEFGYFATIGAAGIVLNLVLMYLLVEWLTLHYLAAKVGAAGVSFVANYGARRWFLFTRRHSAEREQATTSGPSR
jgi:putative flippase GtrA